MLQRIASLEPGIQHPVRINVVGGGSSVQRAPNGQPSVLPKPVDNHGMIPFPVSLQPGNGLGRIAVAGLRGTQGVERDRKIGRSRGTCHIEAHHFGFDPMGKHRRDQLPDSLDGAAAARIDRVNHMQNFHSIRAPFDTSAASGRLSTLQPKLLEGTPGFLPLLHLHLQAPLKVINITGTILLSG